MASAIDYDLHGLVSVRVVDASPGDAAAVARQLGVKGCPETREPDLLVRFVAQLPASSPLHYLGLDDVGFTDDAFLVLHSKYKARARVQIPMEEIGGQCRIVCQTGLPAVPLLIPILNLTMLSKGILPMHASAFVYRGVGVLATGWSKGGKTETLLAFMARGARYVGDEWVYLTRDGRMYGIPEPIRLWDWHLGELPKYRSRIGRGDGARLRALRWALALHRLLLGREGGRADRLATLRRMATLIERQRHVDVSPQRLFGPDCGQQGAFFDRLCYLANHESPRIVAEPIEPEDVAARMAFSLEEERADFMSYYRKFRFAFPRVANPRIERAAAVERELLAQFLSGKPALAVYHPYPVKIPALFEAVAPLCQGTPQAASPTEEPLCLSGGVSRS